MAGSDAHGFANNYVVRRASERALLIISEAAKALPEDLIVKYPSIDWIGVQSLGNVLRHEYQTIDPDTLWEILTGKLPELESVIDLMISDLR